MSLINLGGGLSAMGGAVASFAGNAAMAQQKADLEKQQAILADQLATTRESAGRIQAGVIAETAATKRAGVEKDLETQREGAATELEGQRSASSEKAANISANAKPTEVKEAEWFATATPEQKKAYAESKMIAAGLPPWMIGGLAGDTGPKGSPTAPPADASAASVTGDVTPPDSSKDAPVQDSVAATDRPPERRPWLSAPPASAKPDKVAAPPAAPTLDNRGLPMTFPKGQSSDGQNWHDNLPEDSLNTLSPIVPQNKTATSPDADDRLSQIPPEGRPQIKMMLDGRMPPPSSMSLSKPYWQNMLALASKADPNFDETEWAARAALRKSWYAGDDSKTIGSLNQSINHLWEFNSAAKDLNNGKVTPFNWVDNTAAENTDDPRINTFNRTQQAVSTELAKLYRGTGSVAEGEIEDWKKTNSVNSGPRTLSSMAPETIKLIDGRIDALLNKWSEMGPTAGTPILLSPRAQAIYDTLSDGKGRYASPAAKAAAANQPGNTPTPAAPADKAAAIPPAPKNVDPVAWAHMTTQERALFQ